MVVKGILNINKSNLGTYEIINKFKHFAITYNFNRTSLKINYKKSRRGYY